MTYRDLDPDLLRAFAAVADHGSFTKAAIVLNRTQSAVSMQIRRLEERLGTELVHRTTARMELSHQGEVLLGYARRILSLNEEAVGQLRERQVEGAVRLGVMEDYGMQVLPPILAEFGRAYPGVHLQMETGLTGRMAERLGDAFDLVIAMYPEGGGDGMFLRREQAVWAAGPHSGTEERDPLPLALYPPGCLFRRWAIEALDAAGRAWRLAFVSHSLGAVEAFARHGLAVTVVKSGTMPRTLRPIPPEAGLPALPRADIRLLRAPRLHPAASLLADHLATGLSQRPAAGRGRSLAAAD